MDGENFSEPRGGGEKWILHMIWGEEYGYIFMPNSSQVLMNEKPAASCLSGRGLQHEVSKFVALSLQHIQFETKGIV